MRARPGPVGTAFAALAFACHAPPAAPPAAAEITALCQAQAAAWNRGDLEGFMRLGYLDSDELVFFSGGSRSQGFGPMLDRYRRSYQSGDREMGRLAFTELEVFVRTGELAAVRGRWDLDFERSPDVGGLFTLLLRRTPDGWRVFHDHTSVDAPPPPASAPE